jgi:NDP-sugar pyrophosphorylase family protein
MGEALETHLKGEQRSIGVVPMTFKALDTADAVRRIRHLLDGDFLVVMGDIITNCDVSALWSAHEERRAVATIALKDVDNPCHYGLAILSWEGRVCSFVEKPRSYELYVVSVAMRAARAKYSYANLANMGIYALSYRILDVLDDNPHLLDFGRHVFPYLVEEGYPVYGWYSEGSYWIDVGTFQTYRQANADVLDGLSAPLRPSGIKSSGAWLEAIRELSGDLRPPSALGQEVAVKAGSAVGPYAVVGKGVIIEEDAQVVNSVIMEDAVIKRGAVVSGSIVGGGARVEEGARIVYSLVEDGAVVPPGTFLAGELVSSSRAPLTEVAKRLSAGRARAA